MKNPHPKTTFPLFTFLVFLAISSTPCFAMDLLGTLTKKEATQAGITVRSRPDGANVTKVWLEFRKDSPLAKFTWIELRMEDEEGLPLLTTRLQPHPVAQGQSENIVTVSFSVDSLLLEACSFWFHQGGGLLGGEILTIKVSDFLDTPEEPSL